MGWELRGSTELDSVPPAPQGIVPLAELTGSPDRVTMVSETGRSGNMYWGNLAE